MPWGRLDDQANGNAKLLALSDAAWRMWGCGLIYCQANLTDGFIPEYAIQSFGVRARNKTAVAEELCRSLVPNKGPLWHRVEGGYQVHDYLQWNESRQQVINVRTAAKQRIALLENPGLRKEIRARDGNNCRYCGKVVHWNDRKGADGGTYDHVAPYGGNSLDNLVVCCRSCNSRKGGRTPAEAGMRLLDPPENQDADLDPHPDLLRQPLPLPDSDPAEERRIGPPAPANGSGRPSERRQDGNRSAISGLLDLYTDLYVGKVGDRPHIDRPKDPAILADLLKQHDEATVASAMRAMFADPDDFVLKHGYAIWLLRKQFNGFLAKARGGGQVASRSQPITAEERSRATQMRRAWGRCQHDPECRSFPECVAAIVQGWRAREAGVS